MGRGRKKDLESGILYISRSNTTYGSLQFFGNAYVEYDLRKHLIIDNAHNMLVSNTTYGTRSKAT